MNTPLVSVMMPAFNVAEHVAEAIESVRRQTYSHWELIVVDDGSSDGTPEVVAGLAERDQRIKLIREPHRGRGAARNRCVRESTGKYIAVCDSDDVFARDRFEKQVRFLEANPDIGVAGGQFCLFEKQPELRPELIWPWPTSPQEATETLLKGKMSIGNGASMIRASLFQKYGLYDEALLRAQDYELFRRFAKNGVRLTNLPEVFTYYRKPPSTQSFRHLKSAWLFKKYADYRFAGGKLAFDEFVKLPASRAFALSLRLRYGLVVAKRIVKKGL